jgi:hypothetical protein
MGLRSPSAGRSSVDIFNAACLTKVLAGSTMPFATKGFNGRNWARVKHAATRQSTPESCNPKTGREDSAKAAVLRLRISVAFAPQGTYQEHLDAALPACDSLQTVPVGALRRIPNRSGLNRIVRGDQCEGGAYDRKFDRCS